jgi:hypothetical protein
MNKFLERECERKAVDFSTSFGGALDQELVDLKFLCIVLKKTHRSADPGSGVPVHLTLHRHKHILSHKYRMISSSLKRAV